MTNQKLCPLCDAALTKINPCRIMESEERWEVHAIRFRCSNDHLIFIANASLLDLEKDPDAYP